MLSKKDLTIIHREIFDADHIFVGDMRLKLSNNQFASIYFQSSHNNFISTENMDIMLEQEYKKISTKKSPCCFCLKNTTLGFLSADTHGLVVHLCTKCHILHRNIINKDFGVINSLITDNIYYCNHKIIMDYYDSKICISPISFCYQVKFIKPHSSVISHTFIPKTDKCDTCMRGSRHLLINVKNKCLHKHFLCKKCFQFYMQKIYSTYSSMIPYYHYVLKLYLSYDLCDYMLKNIAFSMCLDSK